MEFLMVFFITLGVGVLLWCLLGLLLMPVFGRDMVTLCFASGDGSRLEQQVRGYGWLRDGRLTGGRMVIVDRGLTPEGEALARRLCGRYPWVSFSGEALPPWVENFTEG